MANNYLSTLNQATDQQMMELSQGLNALDLTDKRVILSNPGTKFDDVYYSRFNTVQQLAEITFNTGRFTQSLSSLQFGSVSAVLIPNGSFLSTFYLHLELISATDQPNVTLCRGWGYAIIAQIQYLMGSSNVPNISLNQQSIFQTIMGQAENAEKRSEILHLAGEEILGLIANEVYTADLVLPFPWSTSVGQEQKLPFPTDLLTNPINVQIAFNSASAIFGGSGVKPTAFSRALCLMRQGDLLNRDAGLRPIMTRNPSLIYGYPFIHFQSAQISITIPPGASSGATNITQSLLGFINADLLGISFGVVRDSNVNSTSNNSVNPFNYEEISDITASFNGLVMYNAPKRMRKLMDMNSINGAGYFEGSILNPGAVAPFTSAPINTYITWIDFSRLRCTQFHDKYENVWRVPSNTISMNYTLNIAVDLVNTRTYTAYFTYIYSGITNVRQGESTIYFD